MKLIKFVIKNKTYIIQVVIFFFFLFIAFIINRIPHGTFVAGGDFYQLVDPSKNFDRYLFSWTNQIGQGVFVAWFVSFPFYFLIAVLGFLGFNSSVIAGFYMFFILYLSYLGFYLSVKLLFPDMARGLRIGGGLVYALNNFTFTIFTYPWGFTHHLLFYIFIPPLIFLYLKILTEKGWATRHFVLFCLVFILSIVSYTNPAFLLLLFLINFLLTIFALLFKQIHFNKQFLIKIIIIGLIYLVLSFWFVLPFYRENLQGQDLSSGVIFGENYLKNWISVTSSNFLNTFLLTLDSSRFPLANIGYYTYLSFAYFVIIFLLLIFKLGKYRRERRIILLFFLLLIIFIFLSIRAYGPFKAIGLYLYSLPIFLSFRSADKIFAVIPFLYTMVLISLMYASRLKQKTIYIIFGILLIIPPFYTNKIYKILSFKNTSSEYNYIVKIPQEYYDIQEYINKDKRLGSIISLPYSAINSLNWSQYPKWNFIGYDILHLFFNGKNYISANTHDYSTLGTGLSFKIFNELQQDSDKLLALIQKFSGKFVIYHKDIDPSWLKNSEYIKKKLEELSAAKKIRLIDSNDYFDLYEVNEDYLLPIMYTSSSNYFAKVNPTKYKIRLRIKEDTTITFNQSFDSQWHLYLDNDSVNSWCEKQAYYKKTNTTECGFKQKFFEGEELSYLWQAPVFEGTHKLVYGYANSWTASPDYIKANYPKKYYKENPDGSIEVTLVVYFRTQSYFYLGLIISGGTLLGCLGYLIWNSCFKRNKNRKNIPLKPAKN